LALVLDFLEEPFLVELLMVEITKDITILVEDDEDRLMMEPTRNSSTLEEVVDVIVEEERDKPLERLNQEPDSLVLRPFLEEVPTIIAAATVDTIITHRIIIPKITIPRTTIHPAQTTTTTFNVNVTTT